MFQLLQLGAKYVFEIFDLECKDQMDTYYLEDALRALNFIPTKAYVGNLGGGTLRKGEKYISVDEFLTMVVDLKNATDVGNYEIFVECLRLYDRHDNGTIMMADLENVLGNMGNFS